MHKTGVGELTVFSDGASRNNPGEAGAGVFIMRNGKPLERIARYLGMTTNNIAEYTAAIIGLGAGRPARRVERQAVREL